jgi:hypothetical protein
MNERAKQLALQALKHPDNDNDGLTVFDNDELEKFAELIVRMCAELCLADYDADIILAHFGVEE